MGCHGHDCALLYCAACLVSLPRRCFDHSSILSQLSALTSAMPITHRLGTVGTVHRLVHLGKPMLLCEIAV